MNNLGSKKQPKLIFSYFELIFDIAYLLFGTIITGIMLNDLFQSNSLKGILAVVAAATLILGDSFHLVPRMASIISKSNQSKYKKPLGIGKQITSITMTLFYILICQYGVQKFNINVSKYFTLAIYFLAIIRVILCALPQNKWTEAPPFKWGIYRNIPFLLLGVLVATFFFCHRFKIQSLQYMWLAIALSFAFYIPVVLLSHKITKIGMLMLPKTIMYLWILLMLAKSM